MSKAFTRETDEDVEAVVLRPAKLPPGVPNYLTASGMERLRNRLTHLLSQPADFSNRQVINELKQSLDSAVVVEPPPLPWEQVLFGAYVTVKNQSGELIRYHLVGVDETDLQPDNISWRSPLARALLKARLGNQIKFKSPGGVHQLTIIDISYIL
ncbi:MAG TPA: GreA/GreB family elongation factor [Candidatus Sulfotelmatobacter sp.]|nr:GreA/GreB family elongation factor [Candidatus Sulfotelmatobacter sp.]